MSSPFEMPNMDCLPDFVEQIVRYFRSCYATLITYDDKIMCVFYDYSQTESVSWRKNKPIQVKWHIHRENMHMQSQIDILNYYYQLITVYGFSWFFLLLSNTKWCSNIFGKYTKFKWKRIRKQLTYFKFLLFHFIFLFSYIFFFYSLLNV